jgi:rhodanese-related sulfurtransferase
MSVRRILPDEAKALVEESGYVYLDVRSIPEFEAGHPPGAVNVPLLHADPATGMRSPNPEFVQVVAGAFPKDTRMVVSCAAGVRSLKAAALLEAEGFTDLVEMRGGFVGERDGMGQVALPGWEPRGYPVTRECDEAHTYAGLKKKAGL